MSSVFPLHDISHLKSRMFFDQGVNIARYDKVKYPIFDGFTSQQLGYFWRPQEVALDKDDKDYKGLTKPEQRIFTLNLKRQTMLDSIQGRAIALALGPIVSLPEVETWIYWWTAFEQLHNKSYTHILQNIYNDPSREFDSIVLDEEIVNCAKDISRYYDELIQWNSLVSYYNGYDEFISSPEEATHDHKVALWKCLIAINALEGIRFYVSFACSWAFAETKRMEGNAKIIKFICRDENLHFGSTQAILKLLPKDDPDFIKIREETISESRQIIIDVAEQEMTWADHLMVDGSMLGLNAELLKHYVQWKTNKCLIALGYEPEYKISSANPLPWTQRWIAGGDVQVAPQETEITSYTSGDIRQDVTKETLKGLSL